MKRLGLMLVMVTGFMAFGRPEIWAKRIYADEVAADTGERNLSPYFLVEGDSAVDKFPLLKTSVKVNLAGIISETELVQVYKNNGRTTLEAIYVFPLGTNSAIHSMKMKIGERIIEAQISEKDRAQRIYQHAKSTGKTASLLQQKRPNVFQMSVANIMPGDILEVAIVYTEIVRSADGIYDFVFPTVVGPRYTGETEVDKLMNEDNWAVNPYLKEGNDAPYDFDIRARIKTGIPLAKVMSVSHKISVKYTGAAEALVTLSEDEKSGGNRDFILKYSLEGNEIQTGLLLYPDEEENYFLLTMEPPEYIKTDMILPREYLFIVDVSGSMHGFPLDTAKALIKNILNELGNRDFFNILFFSGGSKVLSDYPLEATNRNKAAAIRMLESMSGSGGTQILDALTKAFSLPKKEGLSRNIITVTDGYVTVEKESFDLIRRNLGKANFFAFGIGSSVNRYIIEGMARSGNGEPFVVTNKKDAVRIGEKFLDYVRNPLLTDIKISFDGFEAYDVEPALIPDLFVKRPLVICGKYKNADGRIKVTGNTSFGKYRKIIDVDESSKDSANSSIKYLWAREKIAGLSDYGNIGQDIKEEVTRLGLKYHLMTAYTSFVAVDLVQRKTGEVVTVKQPLPLPQGVSNLAVGGYSAQKSEYKMYQAVPASEPAKKIKARGLSENLTKTDRCTKENDEGSSSGGKIYVTGGVTPAGTALYEIETVVLAKISAELEKVFNNWGITHMDVRLEVKTGRVISVKIQKYSGRECDEDAIKKIFKKAEFKKIVTGTVELNIDYIR